ncbi:PhiH1 repressor family protein, contains HTH domain [Halanaeroarchaeum sp. HSR-CO]|uniref:hypothetical protein n=1 Tax=Halanaeroarchaeum sp. HSR-CO TaxID=2866382 RepID=UPI00217D774D|nr:hypothetical protein [Halanaeroarchaeum sp. HSR-CO]UWG46591.1 PhiH1 repressor family protein, contains HTH domain [Halanaeroarchaeum sp. HSR-CO]
MQQLDERILEHLSEEGWSTPHIMAKEPAFHDLEASKARIGERCRALADVDFIAPIHGDMYEITTWGQLYLDGDLDADNQAPRRSVLG